MTSKKFDRDRSERLREMREHVGVDPTAIVSGEQVANRAARRLAAKVLREATRTGVNR